jgi:AbrB family looped-hinge helix DNA binding protein
MKNNPNIVTKVMGNASITHYGGGEMATSTSKLTRKYQATIPAPVRKLLNLEAGDVIAFEINDQRVELRKAQPLDMTYLQGVEETLSEWASPADEQAYGDL